MKAKKHKCKEAPSDKQLLLGTKWNFRICPCPGPKTYTHCVFKHRLPRQLPRPIAVDEVRSKAEPMSRRIWTNFELLRSIIERLEFTIQRRWLKKSKNKRRQALNTACK